MSADRTLREIALAFGTDKAGAHAYTDAYERHLGPLRDRAITLLEIGIGGAADPTRGGASLRTWKDWFPNARVVGLDIWDKSALAEERISIVQGDQGDPEVLARLAAEHGPFDVIIDDGSHRCAHVITTFRGLFPHLADDGVYVIEDLQTSYWERYGGSSGPDRRATTMTFLHGLADGTNHAEFDIPGYVPSDTDRWVRAITFYHNIAFIQKGPNEEPSNQLPPHPRTTVLRGKRSTEKQRSARSRRSGPPSSMPRRVRRAVGGFRRAVRRAVRRVARPRP